MPPFEDNELESELNGVESAFGEHVWGIFDTLAEYDIANMVETCRSNNIKAIISTYPADTQNLYSVHKKIATEFGIALADNFAAFNKLTDVHKYLSKDGWHPNEKGYRIVAQNIYRVISANKIIDVKGSGDEDIDGPSARSVQ